MVRLIFGNVCAKWPKMARRHSWVDWQKVRSCCSKIFIVIDLFLKIYRRGFASHPHHLWLLTVTMQVCGSNGVTYADACQMKVMACKQGIDVKIAGEGPCERTPGKIFIFGFKTLLFKFPFNDRGVSQKFSRVLIGNRPMRMSWVCFLRGTASVCRLRIIPVPTHPSAKKQTYPFNILVACSYFLIATGTTTLLVWPKDWSSAFFPCYSFQWRFCDRWSKFWINFRCT